MSERQMYTDIRDVEISHKARYFFASALIKKDYRVLDACCGVGYGSMLMSNLTHAESITAFDKSEEAIRIATKHFMPLNVVFIEDTFEHIDLGEQYYDLITCFECIEHVEDYKLLLSKLVKSLRIGGSIILSTPNEHRMHWTKEKFPEHLRHFTSQQILDLLDANGIRNIIPYSQEKFSPCIRIGDGGQFLLFVGTK